VHHLQGEAEGVTSPEQRALLQEFYRDRLALLNRHLEGAKVISDYEFNNTYQYIIAREDMHIAWVADAVRNLDGDVPTQITPLAVPSSGKGEALQRTVIDDDIVQAQRFVDRWRERVETFPHARHRTLLKVILGEVLEHKRFFEQAKSGRDDLLGRRMAGASTGDGVLPTRWLE
jgi:hypothetical protein